MLILLKVIKIHYLLNGLFNRIDINIYDKYIQYTYNDNIFGCINTFNKKILMKIFYKIVNTIIPAFTKSVGYGHIHCKVPHLVRSGKLK